MQDFKKYLFKLVDMISREDECLSKVNYAFERSGLILLVQQTDKLWSHVPRILQNLGEASHEIRKMWNI